MRVIKFWIVLTVLAIVIQPGFVFPTYFQKSLAKTADVSDCDWPSFGRTADNNRVAPDDCGPTSMKLDLKWSWELFSDQISTGMAIDNGLMYFGTEQKIFYCIRENSKNIVWSADLKTNLFLTPAVLKGKVFVGTQDKKFYCLGAIIGNKIWMNETQSNISCPPEVADGVVYYGTEDGTFFCADQLNGALKWSFKTKGKIGGKPLVSNGLVYLRSNDANLYCLNARDGKKVWSAECSSYALESPAISDNRLYVNSGSNLLCFEAGTGKLVWEYKVGKPITNAPAVSGGFVIFCTEMPDTRAYCLDASTGREKWIHQVPIQVDRAPVVFKEEVYLGSGPYFTCLELSSGEEKWQYKTDDSLLETPIVYKDKLYFATNQKTIVCLDPVAGELVWDHSIYGHIIVGDPVSSSSTSDGKIYFGADDKKVHCLDALTGNQIWEFRTGGEVKSTPAIWDKKVYFGSNDGYFYCIDEKNGNKIWQYQVSSRIDASPNIDGGKVVIGTTNGAIYCFDCIKGDLIWQFPASHYVYYSPAIWQGRVYFASGNSVYCLSLENGDVIWKDDAGNYSTHWGSVVVSDERVFCGGSGWYFECLDANTGTILWKIENSDDIGGTPIVWEDKIYTGSWNNSLYCLDMFTGKQIWSFSASDRIDTSPLICNGNIYFTSSDGKFYGLDAQTGARGFEYTNKPYCTPSPSIFGGNIYFVSWYKVFCFSSQDKLPADSCRFKAKTARKAAQVKADQSVSSFRIDTSDEGGTKPKINVAFGDCPLKADGRLTAVDSVQAGQSFIVRVNVKGLKPGTYKIPLILYGCETLKQFSLDLDLRVLPPDQPDDGQWSTFGRNTDGNRVATKGSGPKMSWPVKLWEQSIRGYIFHSPIVWNNKIFLGSDDGLCCTDINTGKIIWTYKGATDPWTASVWDDKVYFGNSKSVFCIDALDGFKYWEYETDSDVKSVPAISDGLLYIGSEDCHLYCLNPLTGELVWKFKADGSVDSNPIVIGNNIYFHGKLNLYCLDRVDQKIVWKVSMLAGWYISPVYSNVKIYSGSSDGGLYCINPTTGNIDWTFKIPSSFSGQPAIWKNNVYMGDSDGMFWCIDGKTGKKVWSFQANDFIMCSPAICDGKVYFATVGKNFYCLDATKGLVMWSFKSGDNIWSSPVVVGGKIIVTAVNWHMYCFGDGTPPQDRDKPEKLIIYTPEQSVDLCSTLQLSADVINKYSEILPGYKFEWNSPDPTGTIDQNGLFTPISEGEAYISCKSGELESYANIYVGHKLYVGDMLIYFDEVEAGKPAEITVDFRQEFDSKVHVKIRSSTDAVKFDIDEFDVIPYDDKSVEMTCFVNKVPSEPMTKFTITVEYSLSKNNKTCTMEVEGVIKYKK